MKIIKYVLLILFVGIVSCEKPERFTDAALNETVISKNGSTTTIGNILSDEKGNTVLVDVWASWCSDCIKGLPDVKQLQSDYPDVPFIFLSVDVNEDSWRKSIEKYNIEGHHYFLPKGLKGDFGQFLNSNWTPRYMVIDRNGAIKLFKAKKATDIRIKEALN